MNHNATIRQLDERDLPTLEAFLRPHINASMLLLSNARQAGLTNGSSPLQGLYLAAFLGGEMVGVLAHYWNGIIIVQAPHYAEVLARQIRHASARSLNGVIGPVRQVESVRRAAANGLTPVFDSEEILYALDLDYLLMPDDQDASAHHSSPDVRRAVPDDAEQLARWSADYNVEVLGAVRSARLIESCRLSVERLIKCGNQWVLCGNPIDSKTRDRSSAGRPLLSSCTFNAVIDECVQIGGVWTPVELRCRGHARALVAGALRAAQVAGASRAVLFTGRSNMPAQRAYVAIGFAAVGDYRILLYRQPA